MPIANMPIVNTIRVNSMIMVLMGSSGLEGWPQERGSKILAP